MIDSMIKRFGFSRKIVERLDDCNDQTHIFSAEFCFAFLNRLQIETPG